MNDITRFPMPKNMIIVDNIYYLKREGRGARLRLGDTRIAAMKRLEVIELAKKRKASDTTKPMERNKSTLYQSMKCRSIKKDIECLTKQEFDKIWERAKGRCEVTGIKFSLERLAGTKRRPYSPSIDRRDASLGYVPDNVRIVCTAVNIAMNEWGEIVLIRIAEALYKNELNAETLLDGRLAKVRYLLEEAQKQLSCAGRDSTQE